MDVTIIYDESNKRIKQITKAVNKLNSIQNYFYFIQSPRKKDICQTERVDWDSFHNDFLSNSEKKQLCVFLTEKQFNDNWFSHEENQFSVISTYGWDYYAPPSLSAYLMYQIAQAVIGFVVDLNEVSEIRMIHLSSKGCMFDFCKNKTDIKLGMRTGIICPQCRSKLETYGCDVDAIRATERILSVVRAEAIGKPLRINENEAFIVMRYSKNDENDNAYKYGIRPALNALGIKEKRADTVLNSGQLLDKIQKGIKESRFVIVKLDSENLNVYFELGLAMGLGKDVLLISNSDFILHLPSDLKNWECLTYHPGDYEELNNKITKFFCTNYHYERLSE